MIWLIVGLFILFFIVWGLISDHQDKMKAKAVKDVEDEYNLSDKINEAKKILSKKNFFTNFPSNTQNNYAFNIKRR